MQPKIVYGDILEQEVEVIVNTWNRNIIPWWLLLPQGVSGAIKKRAGYTPFRELARLGPIPLGQARLTSAGLLSYKAIIHVAGINMFWCATANSVLDSVRHSMQLAQQNNFKSIAFPLIGAGSGNRSSKWSLELMLKAFEKIDCQIEVLIVIYKKRI